MRTFIKTSVAVLGLQLSTAVSYSQGQITFANSSATAVTYGNGPNQGSKVSAPGNTYTYALYLGPSDSRSFNQLTLVDTTGNPDASIGPFTAGVFNGGTLVGTGNSSSFPIFAGTTYAVEVVAWTTADGSLLASEYNGDFVGFSGIGEITPTAIPAGSAQVFGGTFQSGFSVYGFPIPEPTTVALIGTGVVALLAFHRKK